MCCSLRTYLLWLAKNHLLSRASFHFRSYIYTMQLSARSLGIRSGRPRKDSARLSRRASCQRYLPADVRIPQTVLSHAQRQGMDSRDRLDMVSGGCVSSRTFSSSARVASFHFFLVLDYYFNSFSHHQFLVPRCTSSPFLLSLPCLTFSHIFPR